MQNLAKSATFALFLTCFCAFFDISANAPEPVRYTLRFPRPQTHYLEVTAQIPALKPQMELYMAVWTPGSYMVREYSRNVEAFTATDENGRSLAAKKTRKNRWLVEAGSAKTLTVAYKVYANEPSVQGNYVDAGFAMLNGAANFVTVEGDDKRAYEVKLELPAAWKESISGLKRTGEDSYSASDFDQLLDSPIYAGNAPIHEFEVDGKKHYLVNEGEGPMWDGEASAKDVAKIVTEYSRMWGGLPYDHYVFFNMLIEAGGGLEHKNSTWMGGSKWAYGNTVVPPPSDDAAPRGPYRPNRLAWAGESRILPPVEREAAAPGGAWTVRLRAGKLHAQPVAGGGRYVVLRRAGLGTHEAGDARPGAAVIQRGDLRAAKHAGAIGYAA